MKIVLCGAGRVGISIAEHLATEDNDITVIDSNNESIQKITELYDVRGVHGIASHPNVLSDAGISEAENNNKCCTTTSSPSGILVL